MSDQKDESEGVGAADPITGVTAGRDDPGTDAVLPDDEEVVDHDAVHAESGSLVVNDAVAGETVLPGAGEGNDGPTGGAPAEASPVEPINELDPSAIDLDDEE